MDTLPSRLNLIGFRLVGLKVCNKMGKTVIVGVIVVVVVIIASWFLWHD